MVARGRGVGSRWSDEQELISDTAWSPQYSDPMVLLVSILRFGEDRLTETGRDEDGIEFTIERARGYVTPEWTDEAIVTSTLRIDPETYEVVNFSMNWQFDVRGLTCDEYGRGCESDRVWGEYGYSGGCSGSIAGCGIGIGC